MRDRETTIDQHFLDRAASEANTNMQGVVGFLNKTRHRGSVSRGPTAGLLVGTSLSCDVLGV